MVVVLLVWFLAGCAHVAQTQACLQFVTCVQELDAIKGMTTNTQRFEAGGGCWGSPAGMELCDEACTRGLVVINQTEASVPASCVP